MLRLPVKALPANIPAGYSECTCGDGQLYEILIWHQDQACFFVRPYEKEGPSETELLIGIQGNGDLIMFLQTGRKRQGSSRFRSYLRQEACRGHKNQLRALWPQMAAPKSGISLLLLLYGTLAVA